MYDRLQPPTTGDRKTPAIAPQLLQSQLPHSQGNLKVETMSLVTSNRPLAPWPSDSGKSRRGSDSSNSSSKARIHSAYEWDSMQSIIKQLYVTEHRKLSEVMGIMDRYYGFKATEQMYKKRFAAWGVTKNRKRVKSKTASSPTDPYPGSSVTEVMRDADICNSRQLCWAGTHAPRYDLIGHSPAEDAIRSIALWAAGSFDSSRWLQTNQQLRLYRANTPTVYPSTRMYQDIVLSYALLDRQQGHLAGLAVRKAFCRIEEVIKVGDPGMMRNLVDIITQLLKSNQFQLLRMLLSQLANLATHRLPKLHPLARFLQTLSRANREFLATLQSSYRCFVENFHKGMNADFYWMYDNWVWDTSNRPMDTDPEADYKRITEALGTLALTEAAETKTVDESKSHLNMLKCTVLMTSDGFKKTSAANILEILRGNGETDITDPKVRTYMKTAKIHEAITREDWSTAMDIMLANVRTLETFYGNDSREVIRELWSLEKVMRKAGHNKEAEALAVDALNRVKKYLSKVPTNA